MAEDTWLQNKKVQYEERKSLFRSGNSKEMFREMLSCSETNFAMLEDTSRICTVLQRVGSFLNEYSGTNQFDWMGRVVCELRITQLGVGQGSFRDQALKCLDSGQQEKKGNSLW